MAIYERRSVAWPRGYYNPTGLVLIGAVALVGGIATGLSASGVIIPLIGWACAGIGGAAAQVGIIALGVQVGIQHVQLLRRRETS